MCDLSQLKHSIQEMSSDYEAVKFIKQVLENDKIQFLKYIIQICSQIELPELILTNSITLISICLRPTKLNSIDQISEKYYTLTKDERDQINKIIIRGLMLNNPSRHEFSYCLSLIFQIDKCYEKANRISNARNPTIFDLYLLEPLQNHDSRIGQIGSVMAITEIIASECFNPKIRQHKNIVQPILDVFYPIFDKLTELDLIDIDFKIEYSKCINQMIKKQILSPYLNIPENVQLFLQ